MASLRDEPEGASDDCAEGGSYAAQKMSESDTDAASSFLSWAKMQREV